MGGKEVGVMGRVKDFVVLFVEDEKGVRLWFVVMVGSDGLVCVWRLGSGEFKVEEKKEELIR